MAKIANDLSLLLKRYNWRPDVRMNPDGTLRQLIRWPHSDDESNWENETVFWLLSNLPNTPQEKGSCAHFAHCAHCGDWFFAGRNGSKFCRSACRVSSHSQTPEGRKQKALYMREQRKQESDRKRKKERATQDPSRMQSASAPRLKSLKQRKGK